MSHHLLRVGQVWPRRSLVWPGHASEPAGFFSIPEIIEFTRCLVFGAWLSFLGHAIRILIKDSFKCRWTPSHPLSFPSSSLPTTVSSFQRQNRTSPLPSRSPRRAGSQDRSKHHETLCCRDAKRCVAGLTRRLDAKLLQRSEPDHGDMAGDQTATWFFSP